MNKQVRFRCRRWRAFPPKRLATLLAQAQNSCQHNGGDAAFGNVLTVLRIDPETVGKILPSFPEMVARTTTRASTNLVAAFLKANRRRTDTAQLAAEVVDLLRLLNIPAGEVLAATRKDRRLRKVTKAGWTELKRRRVTAFFGPCTLGIWDTNLMRQVLSGAI